MNIRYIEIALLILAYSVHLLQTKKINNPLKRARRDFDLEAVPEMCDFGSVIRLTMCYWNVPENITAGTIHWRSGMGVSSYWIGGPRTDHTGADKNSGYVFYETSELAKEMELHKDASRLVSPMYNH
ncbi:hypothetical protein X975_04627, partial [Stegodyphus mimosarum]